MFKKKILIAGEGGQGIQVLAKVLTETAFSCRNQVTFLPNFGVEQRGGVSLAFIQISDFPISFPKFHQPDLAIVFSERALKRIEHNLNSKTVIIFDNSIIPESSLSHLKLAKIAIPATHIAKTKLVPRSFNIIMLGAISEYLPMIKNKNTREEMVKLFLDKYEKEPELKHFNAKAFEVGVETMRALKIDE